MIGRLDSSLSIEVIVGCLLLICLTLLIFYVRFGYQPLFRLTEPFDFRESPTTYRLIATNQQSVSVARKKQKTKDTATFGMFSTQAIVLFDMLIYHHTTEEQIRILIRRCKRSSFL